MRSSSQSREADQKNKDRDSQEDVLICEKEGCDQEAERWTIDFYSKEEDEMKEKEQILCYEHAADAGFCIRCGGFFGGVESYHFTGLDGYCSECSEVIKQEIFDEPEPPEEWVDPNPYGLMDENELKEKEGLK